MSSAPSVSTTNTRRPRGGGGGGQHWNENEIQKMLDKVKDLLPRGGHDWESFAFNYNQDRPHGRCIRDLEAIRNKFKSLRNCKKPTGILVM